MRRMNLIAVLQTIVVWFSVLLLAHCAGAACGSDPSDDVASAAARVSIESQCDCATSPSRASYVSCARGVVRAAISDGSLPKKCSSTVMRCASQSTCGRAGAVACYRENSRGVASCRIAASAAQCQAPSGGNACAATATTCCDAISGGLCPQTPGPTLVPRPVPTLPPLPDICRAPAIPLALSGIQVPFITSSGTTDCGGPLFDPDALPPFSGAVSDHVNGSLGTTLGHLGLGCLYLGALPPSRVAGGTKTILSIAGLAVEPVPLVLPVGVILGPTNLSSILQAIGQNIPLPAGLPPLFLVTGLKLGPMKDLPPSECTAGAGPGRHCSNGAQGTDGVGNCDTDADCRGVVNACNFDANCYFGPPSPVHNGAGSVCAINVFQTDMCGVADLLANKTTLGAIVSSRIYFGAGGAPCPLCVNNLCQGGQNDGQPCTPQGDEDTSLDCMPLERRFVDALTVPLQQITTGAAEQLADANGHLCVGQPDTGAFGLSDARSVTEVGANLSPSLTFSPEALPTLGTALTSPVPSLLPDAPTLSLEQTIAATTCVPAGGGALDALAHLPQTAALAAHGNLYLPDVLVIPLIHGFPVP